MYTQCNKAKLYMLDYNSKHQQLSQDQRNREMWLNEYTVINM